MVPRCLLPVRRTLCILQALLTGLFALLFLCLYGWWSAGSALLGGLICVLGSVLFSSIALFRQGALSPRKMVLALYLAECSRFAVTILAFVLVFWLLRVHALAFFLGYIGALSANWLVLLLPVDRGL